MFFLFELYIVGSLGLGEAYIEEESVHEDSEVDGEAGLNNREDIQVDGDSGSEDGEDIQVDGEARSEDGEDNQVGTDDRMDTLGQHDPFDSYGLPDSPERVITSGCRKKHSADDSSVIFLFVREPRKTPKTCPSTGTPRVHVSMIYFVHNIHCYMTWCVWL